MAENLLAFALWWLGQHTLRKAPNKTPAAEKQASEKGCKSRVTLASFSLLPPLPSHPLHVAASITGRVRKVMATVLNLDFMQTMARMVRESFVSQALLCVLVLGFLKVVVASWRCVAWQTVLDAYNHWLCLRKALS